MDSKPEHTRFTTGQLQMNTITLFPHTVTHRIRLSEALYEIYSKIHRVQVLTNGEYQILYTLKQDPNLGEDHRSMLTRIFYTLDKNEKERTSERSYA